MSTRPLLRAALLAGTGVLLAAGALPAQNGAVCGPGERLRDCYSRVVLLREQPPVDTAELRSAERDDLKGKAAGPDPVSDVSSAIRDFLPRFATSLLSPGPAEGPSALSLRANLPLLLNDGVLSTWGLTAQLGTVVHKAQPFAALVDSLPESLRETTRTRLQEGMELYDDLSLTGALNYESEKAGRSFRSHEALVQRLARELRDATPAAIQTERDAADVAYDFFITEGITAATIDPSRAADPACALTPRSRPTLPVACLSVEGQVTHQRLLQRIATAEQRWREDAQRRIRTSGFNRISELINNQPQANATVEYRYRTDVAGPDEWKGKARFEYSRANMNRLRGFCAPGPVDLACLARFTSSDGVLASLSRGGRFWTELDVNHRPTYRVSLADEGVAFSLASATTLAVSGGYGAYFGNPADGANRDRFDLQGKYDFARDDALRQDRFVGTAFYTRHLSDQSSAVLGLTWASKPEFVGDVNRRLGANLGFTYKLHQPDRQASTSGGGSQ